MREMIPLKETWEINWDKQDGKTYKGKTYKLDPSSDPFARSFVVEVVLREQS